MENSTIAILNLVLSATMVVATIVYVLFTARLVKESRLLRQSQLEAQLICYLTVSETQPDLVSLIFENVGKGVATNVKGKMIKDIIHSNRPLGDKGLFTNGWDYFPPDHKKKYFLLSLQNNYNEVIEDYFEFELTYSDFLKRKITERVKIAFKEVKGFSTVTPPESYIGMIAHRLEKIEKIIEKK